VPVWPDQRRCWGAGRISLCSRKNGQIPVIRVGRLMRVPKAWLNENYPARMRKGLIRYSGPRISVPESIQHRFNSIPFLNLTQFRKEICAA